MLILEPNTALWPAVCLSVALVPSSFIYLQTAGGGCYGSIMPIMSQEPIQQAERELAEVKGLVDEQYGRVMRLKRIGANTQEAVRSLIDLLELQQTREQRLAQARIHHRHEAESDRHNSIATSLTRKRSARL